MTGRPSTASASVSPSPSRTGPLSIGPGVKSGENPPASDAMHQHNVQAAEDFAAYFYRAVDWSIATMDTYLINQVSDVNCAECQDYTKAIDDLARAGGHYDGGRISVTGLSVVMASSSSPTIEIDVTVSQTPANAIRPGQLPSPVAFGTSRTASRVYVAWIGEQWRVTKIGLAS